MKRRSTLPAHVSPSVGLFTLAGSALPRVLPWAAIAAVYTGLLHHYIACDVWPSFCANGHPNFKGDTENSFLFVHTYSYHAILFASGFFLVMRLNQSMARYWEARSSVANMAAKWLDGAIMALAFDEAPTKTSQPAEFGRAVLHLASLLHAVTMHTLRDDATLDTLSARSLEAEVGGGGEKKQGGTPIAMLGGVSEAERRRLACSAERVHLVIGWWTRLLVRRRKSGGLDHDAPIVSRIYQVISDGALWFGSALKIVDTPFPHPYAQLCNITCLVHLALFPVVVADKIASLPLAIVVSFLAVGFFFALNEVAMDLEDPFKTTASFCQTPAHFLHVPLLQAHYDERLLAVWASSPYNTGAWPDDEDECYGPYLREAIGPLGASVLGETTTQVTLPYVHLTLPYLTLRYVTYLTLPYVTLPYLNLTFRYLRVRQRSVVTRRRWRPAVLGLRLPRRPLMSGLMSGRSCSRSRQRSRRRRRGARQVVAMPPQRPGRVIKRRCQSWPNPIRGWSRATFK